MDEQKSQVFSAGIAHAGNAGIARDGKAFWIEEARRF
jgi:hypothetical protein